MLGIASILLLSLFAHILLGGTRWISPSDLVRELVSGPGGSDGINNTILWAVRLPRTGGCLLAGAILGSVGCAFQALFRNPLADPYIVGVSGGASVGGALAVSLGLGALLGPIGLLALSMIGGLLAVVLVLGLGGRNAAMSSSRLILAGAVVASLLGSLSTVILLMSGKDSNMVLRWMMGSTTPMSGDRLLVMLSVLLVGLPMLMMRGRGLNALAISEQHAPSVGVSVRRLRLEILAIGSLMTAGAVGAVGMIGFLGLVAPHLARNAVGVDVRRSLVGSALLGAALLIVADVLAQRLLPGQELPVGAVTAILGAPFLLTLLRREGAAL